MNSQSGFRSPEPSGSEKRFDEEAARRILRRAAEDQARREDADDHSYTLEQLQEIATEAGISPEAVRAAALEDEASLPSTTSESGLATGDGAGGWITRLESLMPAAWSPRLKHAVLVAVGLGLFGLLVSVVGVAPVAFALSIVILVVLVLLLVGLGPF
jgi:hypothetical protein